MGLREVLMGIQNGPRGAPQAAIFIDCCDLHAVYREVEIATVGLLLAVWCLAIVGRC